MDPAKFTPRGARGVSVISIRITFYIGILRVETARRGWVVVQLVVDWGFVAVAVASPSHMVLRL
jgi:hypothetical protein